VNDYFCSWRVSDSFNAYPLHDEKQIINLSSRAWIVTGGYAIASLVPGFVYAKSDTPNHAILVHKFLN